MKPTTGAEIPSRAETLEVLRLMGDHVPILMLTGDPDGYGTRWTIHGQQVQPGIARYLLESGHVADMGATQFGARKLCLTDAGRDFRTAGLRWWAGLGPLQRLWIRIFG